MPPKLFTTAEAAVEIGRSYDITRKKLRGKIPAKIVGTTKFWTLKQIESVRTK